MLGAFFKQIATSAYAAVCIPSARRKRLSQFYDEGVRKRHFAVAQ